MANCSKFMRWLGGPNSWLCKRMGICLCSEKPTPPEEEIVVRECTESHLLENPSYCPDDLVEKITYKKGDEPTEICNVHVAQPIIKVPYIVGTSFYQILAAKAEDIIWWVESLHKHGATGTEMFFNFSWPLSKYAPWCSYPTSGWQFSPHARVGWWSEPKFGNYQFPKFDLEQYNPHIWNRVKLFFSECVKYDIAVFIRIQDYCSVKRPFYKRHYCYNKGSNVQEYTGGTWGEPVHRWYSADNAELMRAIKEVGLKKFYIIAMNEANAVGHDPDSWKDQACKEFHEFYIADFMKQGVSKEQFIINIDREVPRKHFENLGYRLEWHGINSPKRMRECFAKHGSGAFPNGDGPDPNAKGQKSAGGNTEASFNQGIEMGEIVKAEDAPGFMYFNRKTESLPHSGDVRLANFDALDGLVIGLS